ncbi:MAG TPA: RagB/SusD family nutrient uptake outer membrane protein, partial [Chitinophagaceae bacterium]
LNEQPKTSFSEQYVFSSVSDAYKVLIGSYSQLAGDNGYGIRVSMYFPVDDDELTGPTGGADNDRRDIARYSLTAANAQIEKPWEQMYTGIERANLCIYNVPKMALYTTGTTQQKGELARIYGEALTLRAQFYLELIKNWGDVPAQWIPTEYEPNLYIPRTNRDTIYGQLLNDLQTAEGLVPWRTDVASLGDVVNDERITKGAVKALRARIALFRGGYSLRVDTKQMERRNDYLTYYAIAKQECADIMARTDEHTLDPSFKDLWKNNVCNVGKSPTDNYGELMFQVAMSGGNSASGDSKLGYYDGPRVNGARGNGLFIVPTYFYSFSPLDARKDVTCAFYNALDNLVTKQGIGLINVADGKYRSDWITPSVPASSTSQYFGVNWIIIRYSDVLLMYAEADNEINNGPSATAIAAYQQVRKRGFGANSALIGTTPTDHDGFFNAIVNERGFEFGGEGIRKYDLLRWNLLGTKIAATKAALLQMSTLSGPYTQLPTSMFYVTGTLADDSTMYANSFYAKSPTSTPAGTTKVTWITATAGSTISGLDPTTGNTSTMGKYAQFFTPGKSELFPIPQITLDANFKLTPQNPNY